MEMLQSQFYSLAAAVVKFLSMGQVKNLTIILMGVSGSGKSKIGKLLSSRLDASFFDGDDFHPVSNIEKMKSGIPLNDTDRVPWLNKLSMEISRCTKERRAIFACSALKEAYRKILSQNYKEDILFIHLHGSRELLKERLANRNNHFFSSTMLDGQLETLEPPTYALNIDITLSPEKICEIIISHISNKESFR